MTFLNPSKTSLSFLLSNNLFICVAGNVFVMELPRELRADCAASRVSSRAILPAREIRCMFFGIWGKRKWRVMEGGGGEKRTTLQQAGNSRY